MTREMALEILSRHRAELADEFGVGSLAIFGSVARNESRPGSDVDVLVDFAPDAHVGLFAFIRLQQRLEAMLARPVDLTTVDALRTQLRERILAEAVRAA